MSTKNKGVLALAIMLIFSTYTLTGQASTQGTTIVPELATSYQPGQPVLLWESMDVPILPSVRYGFAMTYNPTNHLAMLFGGLGMVSPYAYLNELWLTNGRQWLEFPTPHTPAARSGASMAYDETRQAAVLFGGGNNLLYFPVGNP